MTDEKKTDRPFGGADDANYDEEEEEAGIGKRRRKTKQEGDQKTRNALACMYFLYC
jgi:hypothetical protein